MHCLQWTCVTGRDKLNWNEACPRKLAIAWMRLPVTLWLANIMTEFSCHFWKSNRKARDAQDADECIIVCLKFLADCYTIVYIHWQWLSKSVGRHSSSSLLSMMKVMVWYFVSSTFDCTHSWGFRFGFGGYAGSMTFKMLVGFSSAIL
jgi:hypothetical protein